MVECQLPKLKVASSSLVARSTDAEKISPGPFPEPSYPGFSFVRFADRYMLSRPMIDAALVHGLP